MNDTDLTRWLDVELRRIADPGAPDRDARRDRIERIALRTEDGWEPASIWSTIINLTAFWLGEAASERASEICGVHLDLTESVEAHTAAERIVRSEHGPLVDAAAAAHRIPRDNVREYVRGLWFANDSAFVTEQILRLGMFEVGRHYRATVGVMRDQAAAQGALV
ncbi:Uncharacterised protein (plasmid) [Tsukamurella tyrosinosolvens]|uniref:Uncharacterized protein n=1 Tax=Tsukamurella tyrosinosolvens TaxID=57704 RepID=A0A1H4I8K5_TSUTY|nr:hypothetical protein [Tsukamurella tyrosinosolvens]SEB29612.1 hypothetical protein SAMN04489793_0036 [Tsukamurella tyrosinosolvens]VEH95865.1 Uncharacterised protein [Tsukamurella tyrosinosolvens]